MLLKIRNKITRKYYKSVYKNRVVLSHYRGLRLLLKPSNHLDRMLKRGLPFDQAQIEFMLDEIRRREVGWFVDVGANFGLYSLSIAKKCTDLEKVIAIEAQVENYNQLCGNIYLNQLDRRIQPINIGASDHQGTLTFLRNAGTSTGTSRILNTAPQATKFHRFQEEQLPVNTLDALLGPLRGRSLAIKIDVEGHEEKVLAGARETLRNNRCILQIEVLNDREAAAARLCADYGLRQFNVIGDDCYFETLAPA